MEVLDFLIKSIALGKKEFGLPEKEKHVEIGPCQQLSLLIAKLHFIMVRDARI